jgi:hypothetical protein
LKKADPDLVRRFAYDYLRFIAIDISRYNRSLILPAIIEFDLNTSSVWRTLNYSRFKSERAEQVRTIGNTARFLTSPHPLRDTLSAVAIYHLY